MNKRFWSKKTALVLLSVMAILVFHCSPSIGREKVNQGIRVRGGFHVKAKKVPPGCRILALQSAGRGFSKNILHDALNNLGVTHTLISTPDPYVPGIFTAAFNAVNLNNFDVIVVGSSAGFKRDTNEVTNALIGRRAALRTWLDSGGGIVAFPEWRTNNPYDYLPLPIGRTVKHGNFVQVITPAHPVMAGITDALLSGWGNSHHIYFTPLHAAYQTLAISPLDNRPLIVAASFGAGRMALSGLDADWHYAIVNTAAAAVLIDNMIGWVCEGTAAVCQCLEDGSRGCISGVVARIGTKAPVAGKTIWLKTFLKKSRKKFEKRVVTDEHGCFIFDNLPQGRYTVYTGGGCKAVGLFSKVNSNGKVNDMNFECR